MRRRKGVLKSGVAGFIYLRYLCDCVVCKDFLWGFAYDNSLAQYVSVKMPRYDDRHGTTRLYVGHLSSRTRSRDLEDVFSRYGR